PRSSARWMAVMDALSSWSPQPNCQPEPPIAQAPKPTGVMLRSELPNGLVFMSIFASQVVWFVEICHQILRRGTRHRRIHCRHSLRELPGSDSLRANRAKVSKAMITFVLMPQPTATIEKSATAPAKDLFLTHPE